MYGVGSWSRGGRGRGPERGGGVFLAGGGGGRGGRACGAGASAPRLQRAAAGAGEGLADGQSRDSSRRWAWSAVATTSIRSSISPSRKAGRLWRGGGARGGGGRA